MNRKLFFSTFALVAGGLFTSVTGCTGDDTSPPPVTDGGLDAQADTSVSRDGSDGAPDAPATDAPVTDAPVTDAPATDAPSDAPISDAPSEATIDGGDCGGCGAGQICSYDPGCNPPKKSCHPDTGGDAVAITFCSCSGGTFTTSQLFPTQPYKENCGASGDAGPDAGP